MSETEPFASKQDSKFHFTWKQAIELPPQQRRQTCLTMTEVCEAAILKHLSSAEAIEDTYPWAEKANLDHLAVVGAVKSLLADDYVSSSDLSTTFCTLSKEAETIIENGSQEMMVLTALTDAGKLSIPELQEKLGKDVAKIGMGNCMKNKWVKKDGADLVPLKTADEVEDTVQQSLQKLLDANGDVSAVDSKVRSLLLFLFKARVSTSMTHIAFMIACRLAGSRCLETTQTC